GFSGDPATRSVEPMSGGEKARLALALIIYQRPNLLLLDEPTNHLDLGLRDALVAALQEYEGALIVVSHDRHLLRTTVDEFCLVASGKAETFDGDLDAYHDWLQQQAANDKRSEQPATRQRDDRKQQKRKEAEARQKTKPLRQQIEKAEKSIHTLELKLADVHEQLSDSSLYDDANKARLQKLLDQQAQAQKDLQHQENLWMMAEEELAELTETLQQTEGK
ncbi:MAG: ATP-binding cassette domain-containing protein, partial [Idiomarina sp.]|nr:ATP-binding cassette domain-containing protein [Idiomarina sp.]